MTETLGQKEKHSIEKNKALKSAVNESNEPMPKMLVAVEKAIKNRIE